MYLNELIVLKLKCVRYPDIPHAKFGGLAYLHISNQWKMLANAHFFCESALSLNMKVRIHLQCLRKTE